MAQTDGDRLNFREVDQHGNPTPYGAMDHADPDPASESRPIDRLTVNPFIIALWVLAVGLIAGASWVFTGAQAAMTSGGVNSMELVYFFVRLAPFAVLAGVLTVLGLLFWHASQWQRRHAK